MVHSCKAKYRPNVIPSKWSKCGTIGDRISDKSNTHILNQTRYKKTVVDVCDICFKYVTIRRVFLSFRIRGWKFAHSGCYREKFGDEHPKDNKFIIGIIYDK